MALSKEEKAKRLAERRQRTWNETHSIIDGIDNKRCSACLGWFPCSHEYFYRNNSNKIDGFAPKCRVCHREESLVNRHENIDRARESSRNWNRKHPEVIDLANKKYRAENKDERRIYFKTYINNNPDKSKEYNAKRNKKNHQISQQEWNDCRIYFNFKCGYCDKTWEENFTETGKDLHKEHVDDNGANDLSNCIPSCQSCNSSKWVFDYSEWYNKNNVHYSEERHNRIQNWLLEDCKKYLKVKKLRKKYERKK